MANDAIVSVFVPVAAFSKRAALFAKALVNVLWIRRQADARAEIGMYVEDGRRHDAITRTFDPAMHPPSHSSGGAPTGIFFSPEK